MHQQHAVGKYKLAAQSLKHPQACFGSSLTDQGACVLYLLSCCLRGGYKVVGQNGGVKWPNGKHGLCGDPAGGPQPFMKPGPVQGEHTPEAVGIALQRKLFGRGRMMLLRLYFDNIAT